MSNNIIPSATEQAANTTSNKNHALAYVRDGLSVFPSKGKKPLQKWGIRQTQLPSEEEVNQHWEKWPLADICCATGAISGIVVVDVDGGEIPSFPYTVQSATSPGHFQFFFKHPGVPIPGSVKQIAPNIDIRGDGGLVVLPESRHFNKETDEQDYIYKWIVPFKRDTLAPLPQWIIKKTQESTSLNSGAKPSIKLKDVINIGEGERDNKMLAFAESLLSRRYDEQDAWETMNAVNLTYNPPLDDKSMNRIFSQAVNFISSQKSSATTNSTYRDGSEMSQEMRLSLPSTTDEAQEPLSQETTKHGMPNPILLSDLSSETYSVEWVLEGFIAKGHKTLFSALFKAGKSTFIGLFLSALEHGAEFLGQQTTTCGVLILTEESKTEWTERRDELELKLPIYILSNPLKYKLSYRDWIGWLADIKVFCKEKKIGLVIVDTISEFWSVTDENKATEITQALMPLNYLTEDNIAVLLVHHFRKSGGTQGTAARGSGALASKVDIIVDFTRYEDNEATTKRRLSCLSRFGETPKEIIIDYVDGKYLVLGSSTQVQIKEKLNNILGVLNGYPDGFIITDVFDNWDSDEYGKKPSKRTIQRHVADLIREQQVEKIKENEMNGKLVPIYRVVTLRQSIPLTQSELTLSKDGVKIDATVQTTIENTHDNSTNHIDTNIIDAGTNGAKVSNLETEVSSSIPTPLVLTSSTSVSGHDIPNSEKVKDMTIAENNAFVAAEWPRIIQYIEERKKEQNTVVSLKQDESSAKSDGLDSCYACGGMRYYLNPSGSPTCSTCHPPVSEPTEWIEVQKKI